MLNATETKTKKNLTSRNNNGTRVVKAKRGRRQSKMIQIYSGSKVNNVDIRHRLFKKKKKSTKKIRSRNVQQSLILEKEKNSRKRETSKKIPLPSLFKNITTKNKPPHKLRRGLRLNPQKKTSEKQNSFSMSTKLSENFSKNRSSNPIFVSLGKADGEKRYKNKFRNPANGKELKRLREKLWNKSSYHKRFLGKSVFIKPEKTEKNTAVKSKKQCSSKNKGYSDSHKTVIENSSDRNFPLRKGNQEQYATSMKSTKQGDLGIKREEKINLESCPIISNKSLNEDVSKIDENYIKSLLLITNCNTEPENMEVKHKGRASYDEAEEIENRKYISKNKYFVSKVKNTKISQELSSKNEENQIILIPEFDDVKSRKAFLTLKNQTTSILRNTAKSETQIKPKRGETTIAKNKEIQNREKNSYSKHEILEMNNDQQKTKTRDMVKNTKKDNTEIPFSCEVVKPNDLQELWRRKNLERRPISHPKDLPSRTVKNASGQNTKSLGIESYRTLKRFVEAEVYRISQTHNKNSEQKNENKIDNNSDNRGKGTGAQQKVISEEALNSPNKTRNKLAVKSQEEASFLREDMQLKNAKILNPNFLKNEKPDIVESKVKLIKKKNPEEIIKNWSIVNRLEKSFLALGTPDFRQIKQTKPAETNANKIKKLKDALRR